MAKRIWSIVQMDEKEVLPWAWLIYVNFRSKISRGDLFAGQFSSQSFSKVFKTSFSPNFQTLFNCFLNVSFRLE